MGLLDTPGVHGGLTCTCIVRIAGCQCLSTIAKSTCLYVHVYVYPQFLNVWTVWLLGDWWLTESLSLPEML